MNLVTDKWLPVLYRDGSTKKISLSQLTSRQSDNPIIRLNFHRADFNAFGTQFLTGVVQSSLVPKNIEEINILRTKPPTEKKWALAINNKAFELDGDRQRFMQDTNYSAFKPDKHTKPINYLLFGSPGNITVKSGRDWFFKGRDVKCMCPSCAAIALYIRQINAFSAGVRYFTAFRSGDFGVMTTLLTGGTLWETILLNVLPASKLPGDYTKPLYPWMSEDLPMNITSKHVHPSHYFWEMPSWIYLNFSSMNEHCAICNEAITYGTYSLLTRNNTRKAVDLEYSFSSYTMEEVKEKGKKEKKYIKKYQRASETFSDFLKGKMLFSKEYPTILKYLSSFENNNPPTTVQLFYETKPVLTAGIWTFGFDYKKSTYNGWVETNLVQVPELFPDIHKVVAIALNLAETLHYYVTRVLDINSFRPSKGMEKKYPDPLFEYFRITEPIIMSAVEQKDITGFAEVMLAKTLSIFNLFVADAPGTWKGHKGIISSFNKILVKLGMPAIDEELYHKKIRKRTTEKSMRLSKELRISVLKWWIWTKSNPGIRNQLSGCMSIEEIKESLSGRKLEEIFGEYLSEHNHGQVFMDRLMKAAQLSVFIKDHDWDCRYLNQVAISKDTRIRDLSDISDPIKDWARIYQMITILQKISVPDFIETIILWNKKISTFNRKASV